MEISMRLVDELIPYVNNQKLHPDAQITKIASSIKEFGFTQPIVIDKEGVVIIGHGRLMAAKKLKMNEVPVLLMDDLSDAQVKALRIADNKLNESDWSNEMLRSEFDILDEMDFDLELTGFDLDEIVNIRDEDGDAGTEPEGGDEVPKVADIIIIKPGDLIEMGKHRVLCGDSTIKEDVEKLMNGELADLAHNDPPYGMKKENDGVLNDNLNYDDLLDFNHKWIPLQFEHLTKKGSWYCWGIDEPLMDIYYSILKGYIKENKITFRNLITWDKGNGMGQLSELHRMYATADEKCLFVMMGKQDLVQNKDQFPDEWRPMLDYFINEREKMGWTNKKVVEITGKTTASHYFTESQFLLPTEDAYEKIQKAAGGKAFTKPFDQLSMVTFGNTDKGKDVIEDMKKNRAYFNNTHDNMNNVWHFSRTSQEERIDTGGHATPKPIGLCERVIVTSCPEKGLVLDFFLGSGSTLIASENRGRRCYGIELDPKYVQVIIQRWCNHTGQDDIKINGKKVSWEKFKSESTQ